MLGNAKVFPVKYLPMFILAKVDIKYMVMKLR